MATDVPFEIDRARRVLGVWGWAVVATSETPDKVIITIELAKEVEKT